MLTAHFQEVKKIGIDKWRCKQGRIWKTCVISGPEYKLFHPQLVVENNQLLLKIKRGNKFYYYKVPLHYLHCSGSSCYIKGIKSIIALPTTLYKVEETVNNQRIVVYKSKESSKKQILAEGGYLNLTCPVEVAKVEYNTKGNYYYLLVKTSHGIKKATANFWYTTYDDRKFKLVNYQGRLYIAIYNNEGNLLGYKPFCVNSPYIKCYKGKDGFLLCSVDTSKLHLSPTEFVRTKEDRKKMWLLLIPIAGIAATLLLSGGDQE